MHQTGLAVTLLFLTLSSSLQAQTSHPNCQSSASDVDGDGWGWEANSSCIVSTNTSTNTPTQNNASSCEDPDGDGYGWNGVETCLVNSAPSSVSAVTAVCEDTDGDGYGWDGSATCIVSTASANTQPVSNPLQCLDPDGDGWGWDGFDTCTVPSSAAASDELTADNASSECVDPDGDGYGWDGTKTCSAPVTTPVLASPTSPSGGSASTACVDPDGDGFGWNGTETCLVQGAGGTPTVAAPLADSGVTDVILMMGQSNALGEDTNVQPDSQDSSNDNIIVWTQFDGWQVADLCTQIWQKGWFPWRGGVCSNHPAFQIAKGIVASDPSRKVAIIPTGVAGKPISWWDSGGVAYGLAKAHTEEALAALPGKSQVDLIAWSQGESDHGNEDYWFGKLNNLLGRLRNESYVNTQSTAFIAQETKSSSINDTLPGLDTDSDPMTSWIRASDLSTKDGTHWNASALRALGRRYAAKYLSIAGL